MCVCFNFNFFKMLFYLASVDVDGTSGILLGSEKYSGNKKMLERCSDERAIKIIHMREMDVCIFPILSIVCILSDSVKRRFYYIKMINYLFCFLFRLNASNSINYRLKRLNDVLKSSFLAICEQEWVINRVFRICETTDMEAFNYSGLKHNSIVMENSYVLMN